jgi:competence protein ComEA
VDPLPGRPLPARPITEVARAWLQWFGLIRLLVVTIAVCGVGAGAFWLLRAPPTPIEDTLPMAARPATSTTTSTDPAVGATVDPSATGSTSSTSTDIAPRVIVVDVAGAVVTPGVYVLANGARVNDAVGVAGGLAADADTDVLNLAATLSDGDRLYVPHVGVPVPTVVEPTGGAGPSAAASTLPAEPLDLNRATADQLDTLPGIGPTTAAAIVDSRERVGPFSSVDDLLRVHGIGPAKLDAIRGLVVV